MAAIPPVNYSTPSQNIQEEAGYPVEHDQRVAEILDKCLIKFGEATRCARQGLFIAAMATLRELQKELPHSKMIPKVLGDIYSMQQNALMARARLQGQQQIQPVLATQPAGNSVPVAAPPTAQEILCSKRLFIMSWRSILKTANFIQLTDNVGNNILHNAILHLGTAECKSLLKNLGVSSLINSQGQSDDTPLHLAIKGDRTTTARKAKIKLLLSFKPDVYIKNQSGMRPIDDSLVKELYAEKPLESLTVEPLSPSDSTLEHMPEVKEWVVDDSSNFQFEAPLFLESEYQFTTPPLSPLFSPQSSL